MSPIHRRTAIVSAGCRATYRSKGLPFSRISGRVIPVVGRDELVEMFGWSVPVASHPWSGVERFGDGAEAVTLRTWIAWPLCG